MPYKVFKQDDEFCVFKVDGAGEQTGSALGCHATRKKAGKQIAALNIAEDKETSDLVADRFLSVQELFEIAERLRAGKEEVVSGNNKEVDMSEENEIIKEKDGDNEVEEKALYADPWSGEVYDTDEDIYGATSFEEYDAAVEAKKAASKVKKDAKIFTRIVDSIIYSDAIQNPGEAIKKAASEFAARFSKREDDMEDDKSVAVRPFMVYKDQDGTMRFLTSYSNNRRDMDNPPEIISAASHERFEKMVDAGEAEYPELWLWHTESLNIGQTDVIAYDKDNGIAMAAGYFHKEAEFIAEAIADNPDFWGVSHGMPSETVKRSKEDPTVIIEHITKEISPLPFQAAANKWADFTVLKEVNMTLAQEKKEQLEQAGIGADMLSAIEEKHKSLNENLDELGIESKEQTSEDAVDEKEQEEVTEEVQSEEAEEKEVPETKEEEAVEELFTKAQVEQLAEVLAVVVDKIDKKIDERLAPVEEQLADKKSVEEAAEELIKQTPATSLTDMLFPGYALKQQSAVQSDDTVIDGRSKLGQDMPDEKKEERQTNWLN
jgi:hypothetical protein